MLLRPLLLGPLLLRPLLLWPLLLWPLLHRPLLLRPLLLRPLLLRPLLLRPQLLQRLHRATSHITSRSSIASRFLTVIHREPPLQSRPVIAIATRHRDLPPPS
jgi:hypothetical protein